MKKSIILLCAFFATLHVYAQDVPAILFFQNDSIIQGFLRSEVDSLGYSYVDINGETQNELTTQLVYLKDTVIQIPLAEIDSVIYTPPSYSFWVLTRNPKDIGHYKATLCGSLGGKFAPDAVINETGFLISYYSKEGKVNKKVSVGNSIGDFEKEIDFKKPEYGCKNIFYYRAYAVVNGVGYVGTERTISLSPIVLTAYSAKVSKEPTTEDECSATVYGDLFLSHRKEIEESGFPMGFFVSKKDNPEADGDDVMRFDGELNENGLIESKLDGLEPGTKYYYRPFIETCKIEYGGTGSFVTPPKIVVTTKECSDDDIKATIAKLSLSIDVKAYGRDLEYFPVGIQILGPRYHSSDEGEYLQFNNGHWNSPHQDFSKIVNNLIPNTEYLYCAYANINGKLYCGNLLKFTTKDLEVRTYDVTKVTSTAGHFEGELMEKEAVKDGENYGFYYDTQERLNTKSPGVFSTFTNISDGKFLMNITDFEPDVTYYYCAFVTYNGQTYYGEVKQFKTREFVVKTIDATDITTTTAHIAGEVTDRIDMAGESFGFYYDTHAKVDLNSYCFSKTFYDNAVAPLFYLDMTDLVPGTTYYYRAFVTCHGKTYLGEVKQFTTEKEGFYGELGLFELKGHVKEYSYLSEDGYVLNTRTFDENGMWLTFDDVTINDIFPYGIQRDEYGRIVKGVFDTNGDHEEYYYDAKGRVTKYIQIYQDGGETHTIYYDESDTMVKRTVKWLGVDREYFDDYELTYSNHVKDSHGNWISRTVSDSNLSYGNYNEMRQITYYK